MGSEADLGVVALAVAIEEGGPLLGIEADAAFHECVGVSSNGSILPFYDPRHFPVCVTLFSWLPIGVMRFGGRRLGGVGRIPGESHLEGGDPSLKRIDQAEDGRLGIGRYLDPEVIGQGRLGAHGI